MGKTQTIISTVAVVILLVVTLSISEGIFKVTDITKSLGETCEVNADGTALVKALANHDVARNALYGTISVRGASISALLLSVIAAGVVAIAKDLDLDMESKYDNGSYLLSGNPRAFVSGIVFRLCVSGAMLSMLIAGVLVAGPMTAASVAHHDSDLNNTVPSECSDLGRTALERSADLSAVFVLAFVSAAAIGLMSYSVKYDAKASA
tara:strand:+ start:5179 stop:5802 length:624 start_codon:yes stop_codon:yes gene_type:complete